MRVLLDTTALYVAAGLSPVTFTPRTQHLLENSGTVRLVSSISLTEVAIKSNKNLTPLKQHHIEKLVYDLNLTLLPLTGEHSLALFGLPAHHNDPFDRMLIAVALAEDVALVAKDREFKKYKGLRVLW